MRLLETVRGKREAAFSENWWCKFLEAGLNTEEPDSMVLADNERGYRANNRERRLPLMREAKSKRMTSPFCGKDHRKGTRRTTGEQKSASLNTIATFTSPFNT